MLIRYLPRLLCAALAMTFAGGGNTVAKLQASDSLATYSFSSSGWATFGLALPAGASMSGVQVGSLPTQTDVKVRHPDGSVRFAIVSARIPSSGTYGITPAGVQSGQVSTALPSASVEILVEGQSYVAQLPATVPASWLNGPLVREGRAVQPFTGGTGAAAALRAIFDVRSYNDGTHRVDVTIANTLNVPQARDVAYGVNIRVAGNTVMSRGGTVAAGRNPITAELGGGRTTITGHGLSVGDAIRVTSGAAGGALRVVTTVVDANTVVLSYPFDAALPLTWEKPDFVQPYLTRWRQTFTTSGFAEASIIPDFGPFQRAGAFPSYLSTVNGPARNASGPRFEPLRLGDLMHPFTAPGARPEIGLLPGWTAQYLVHKRQDQRAYMLAMGGNVAGAVSLHVDDGDGSMLLLDRHPDFNLNLTDASGGTGLAGNQGAGLNRGVIYAPEVGAAHTPSLSYVPYLLTGDRFYLDELKYWANAAMLTVSWERGGAQGLVVGQQIRAIAWALRDIADAAAYTPDDDPHRAYFVNKTNNNIAALDKMARAESDSLGGSLFGQPSDSLQQIFMQSFAAWSFSHVADQGFSTPLYVKRLVEYWNAIYNAHPSFDKRYVVSYQHAVISPLGASFTSYADLFDYNLNRRPVEPWKNFVVPYAAGGLSYNRNAYVLAVLAKRLGLPNADAQYEFVLNGTDGGATTIGDLNMDAQYAVGVTAAASGAPPLPPTGVRLVN